MSVTPIQSGAASHRLRAEVHRLAVPMLLACLLSACEAGGETIVREVAVDAEGNRVQFADPNDPSSTAATPPVPVQRLVAASNAISGAPGVAVDCENQLPCRWIAADRAWSMTVSSVDNIGGDEALVVHFSIDSLYDSSLRVGAAGNAVGESGTQSRSARVTLAGSSTVAAIETLAGSAVAGDVEYADPVRDSTLADWRISILDNGEARDAVFRSLPIGAEAADEVDCALVLPCTWVSNDASATVQLETAGGFTSQRRLQVSFSVIATEPMSVAVGPATVAISADGASIGPRSHRIESLSGHDELIIEALPGSRLTGEIDFFRSPATSDLAELVLDVYRGEPVPRWRPRFLNIPVLTP